MEIKDPTPQEAEKSNRAQPSQQSDTKQCLMDTTTKECAGDIQQFIHLFHQDSTSLR
jgi:hypothetical protein